MQTLSQRVGVTLLASQTLATEEFLARIEGFRFGGVLTLVLVSIADVNADPDKTWEIKRCYRTIVGNFSPLGSHHNSFAQKLEMSFFTTRTTFFLIAMSKEGNKSFGK